MRSGIDVQDPTSAWDLPKGSSSPERPRASGDEAPRGIMAHDVTGDDRSLSFVNRIERSLTDHRDQGDTGEGSRWIRAEHRTQPENVAARTGWMQGAAGVGAFFVHLDGKRKEGLDRVLLPDSPWGCGTSAISVDRGGHGS